MPYCEPEHFYHEDIAADNPAGITYCRTCLEWHHNYYRCPHAVIAGDVYRYLQETAGIPYTEATGDPGRWVPASSGVAEAETGTPDGERPDARDLDLADLWAAFRPTSYLFRQSEFQQYLRELASAPATIDELEFCTECGDPGWGDEYTNGMCEPCWDECPECSSCGNRISHDCFTETLSGSEVCESCRDSYYSYCDYCDGYYPDSEAYEHGHGGGDSCCESPALQFRVRNDGAEPLANDTRAAFTLPAGTISDAGMKAISRYLRNTETFYSLAYDLEMIGDQWQTRNGNFAKRLSRHAYRVHSAKLTPEVMSQVGCIARDHSKQADVEIEVTRDLNQDASYFLHEDSCYWGGYYESRCVLKTNGGFGLRSFKDGQLSGRAWVIPLRQGLDGGLAPTFDTITCDAFVVFNGYGDLGGYTGARIMAYMAGWTYRKVNFECGPVYVNAGGYLIAPEDIAAPYTDRTLSLSVSQHSSLHERETQTQESELSYA